MEASSTLALVAGSLSLVVLAGSGSRASLLDLGHTANDVHVTVPIRMTAVRSTMARTVKDIPSTVVLAPAGQVRCM